MSGSIPTGANMDTHRLENFILSRMSETRIPGLSIAIIKGDEVIYARGFGFRDIARGLPATPRTVYGIGSVTKSFTALAILKLVEEGKLSLDDPVEKYIPLKLRSMGEPICIHHLLTHSSGIPALAYAEAFLSGVLELDSTWLPVSTPEDVIAYMSDAENWAVAKPGEKFFYLNEGYVLLGYIISKITGIRYEEYVKRNILGPLAMNRSYFYAEEVEKDLDVAMPYIIDKDGRHIPRRFPFGITADGGLLSNTLDMARYIAMLINRGELNGVRIVSRESIELMERKYIDVPWKVFGDEGYGYGLIITERFLGRKLVEHGGSVIVHTAYMGYLPQERIGVIVLANASGYPLSNIGMYALALALGYDPEKELEFLRIEKVLRLIEGVYETYRGIFRYIVKRHGEFLALVHRNRYGEETTILVPEEVKEDYARFFTFYAGRKLYAEFFINGDKVTLFYERYKLVKTRGAS